MRSELVAFIGPDDDARRAALMNEPRQRSWGSVVEDFVRHRDRKYTFDAEGRAVRRHVLARRKNLVGLGKEANRVEDSRVLGLAATRGRAKRYVDPDPRVGSATVVADRLGVSRRTVFNLRRRSVCTMTTRSAGRQSPREEDGPPAGGRCLPRRERRPSPRRVPGSGPFRRIRPAL
jgi:hypothetical protein